MSVFSFTDKKLFYFVQYETTDDESYTERHMRCEVNEKKKFADCYRHTVVRRRTNHLSESTASGPPSPLVSDELRPVAPTTPIIDSPQTMAAALMKRLTNLILIPGEERDLGWPLRDYPLNASDCAKLSIVTTSSINTPNTDWRYVNNNNNNNNTETPAITTNKHLSSTTSSTHSSYSTTTNNKYFEHTTTTTNDNTNNTPPPSVTTITSPHRTSCDQQQHAFEDTPPLPTPLYTPVDTPMPSPLSPECLDGDGEDPSRWNVKDTVLDGVNEETGQVKPAQDLSPHSTVGGVLKIAK